MTRTDVHAPKSLVTEDYEFVLARDNRKPEDAAARIAALANEGWGFAGIHPEGQCDHCGARLRYEAILKHKPSHALVHIGEQCLENRFNLATIHFQRLRKEARMGADKGRLTERQDAWIKAHKDLYEYLAAKHKEYEDGGRYSEFIESLWSQLLKRGELTERQVDALRRGIEREKEWEGETNAVVPNGTTKIKGRILSIKPHDSVPSLAMTIKDDRGWRVWGAMPSTLEAALTAHMQAARLNDYMAFLRASPVRIEMEASTRRSRDAMDFGFFDEPTSILVL